MERYDYVRVHLSPDREVWELEEQMRKVIDGKERHGWQLVQTLMVPERPGRYGNTRCLEFIFERSLQSWEH